MAVNDLGLLCSGPSPWSWGSTMYQKHWLVQPMEWAQGRWIKCNSRRVLKSRSMRDEPSHYLSVYFLHPAIKASDDRGSFCLKWMALSCSGTTQVVGQLSEGHGGRAPKLLFCFFTSLDLFKHTYWGGQHDIFWEGILWFFCWFFLGRYVFSSHGIPKYV